MSEPMSGKAIALMQEAEGRQCIIDCSMAMRPAWDAALRELYKDLDEMEAALNEKSPAPPVKAEPG